MARLGARDRRDPALHRVHGRRPLERLAARRGRAGRRARRHDRGGAGRSSRPSRPTAARSPTAGATSTARGEFGVISSVTQPFCRDCTRARISAEGKLYTCLFAVEGHDLRARPARRRDRRRAGRAFIDGDLVAPRRPLLRAALGGDLDAAEDRDVRDGRLSRPAAGRRASSTGLSTGVGQLVDGAVAGRRRTSWITALTRPTGRPVP